MQPTPKKCLVRKGVAHSHMKDFPVMNELNRPVSETVLDKEIRLGSSLISGSVDAHGAAYLTHKRERVFDFL